MQQLDGDSDRGVDVSAPSGVVRGRVRARDVNALGGNRIVHRTASGWRDLIFSIR
jgi:hypothetical protein